MSHLIHMIQPLPNLVVLGIVVGLLTALAALAPLAGHYILRLKTNPDRDTAAFDSFKVILGMAAIVLSFSLVQATGNVNSVEGLIGREAYAFASVDRALFRFGTPEAAAARPLLEQYGKGRIELEWPSLAHGERSRDVDVLFSALSRTARGLQPADQRQQTMFAELLKNMDDLAEARELVIAAADTQLSNIFWIMSGGLLIISIGLALLTDPTPQRMLNLGATAAAVSLLFAFVIITDRPFVGESAIEPTAIVKMLVVNSRRT